MVVNNKTKTNNENIINLVYILPNLLKLNLFIDAIKRIIVKYKHGPL